MSPCLPDNSKVVCKCKVFRLLLHLFFSFAVIKIMDFVMKSGIFFTFCLKYTIFLFGTAKLFFIKYGYYDIFMSCSIHTIQNEIVPCTCRSCATKCETYSYTYNIYLDYIRIGNEKPNCYIIQIS